MVNYSLLEQHETIAYDRSAPAALIVADDAEAARSAAEAATLAGCVSRAPIGLAEAARDPGIYDGIQLILIEAAAAPDALLELVLARADTISRERMIGVVVTITPGQIDLAAGQLLGRHSQLLCEPDMADRIAAIGAAKWVARGVMEDVDREAASVRLRRLNEEVARIADALARLTRDTLPERSAGVRDDGTGYRGPDDDAADPSAAEVRGVIRARRMRAQFFAEDLFADPAWDMLLDLFAAHLERGQVSVSSLCIAAAVPPTTALRWIGSLHEAGLFERRADPEDRRRAYIALSAKGLSGMRNFAGAARRAGLPLV